MTTLTEADLAVAAQIVRAEIVARSGQYSTDQRGQPMVTEWLDPVTTQVLVPLIVGLTTNRISDILKERKLTRLRNAEAKQIIADLVGSDIRQSGELDSSCHVALASLLAPMGFGEKEVDQLVEQVRRKVASKR